MENLISYSAKSYYSQEGEDGIVEEILNRLRNHIELDRWCSEFGAWDGVYLSNTCHFIRNHGYKAVLIEGDKSKIKLLNKNHPSDNVLKINKFISFEGLNSLDSVYSETPIPINFDFLSIDVDGVDYHIFESLRTYRPKIICIEFNPTIPNSVDFVQPKDMSVKQGNSAKSITTLAQSKGYSLVSCTRCNLFFVERSLLKFVIDREPLLEEINELGNSGAFVFCGYDGSILSNVDYMKLNWHGISVPIKSTVQFFPKYLRKFSSDYGFSRWLFFFIYVLIKLPHERKVLVGKVVKKIIKRFKDGK